MDIQKIDKICFKVFEIVILLFELIDKKQKFRFIKKMFFFLTLE